MNSKWRPSKDQPGHTRARSDSPERPLTTFGQANRDRGALFDLALARLAGRRVVILLENLPFPEDRRVRREAEALRDAGARVTILAPKADGQVAQETCDGIAIRRFVGGPQGARREGYIREYAQAFWQMTRLLRQLRAEGPIDVLHTCTPPDLFFPLAWWCRLGGTKFVFDHHDPSPELYLAKGGSRWSPLFWALRAAEWCSLRSCDVVIASSEPLARIARCRGGVDSDRIFLVRTGLTAPRFGKQEGTRPQNNGRSPVVAFLGCMGTEDGLDHLVEAARIIRHDRGRNNVRWLLIGDGPERLRIEQQVDALDLRTAFRFTGFVSEERRLADLLSSADVCVTPDPVTPFNECCLMAKVLDYLAAGRAQVAFPLPETVAVAGDAADFVKPNSSLALAEGVLAVLDDHERRSRMEAVARDRAPTFVWKHSTTQLLGAYARALADA